MLIDIHVHCSKARHPKVSRSAGSQYPTPSRLIEMLDEAGIDKAVVMSTVSPECRYTPVIPEETIEICALYPDRLIPFCNLDPRYLSNSTAADTGRCSRLTWRWDAWAWVSTCPTSPSTTRST